MRKLDISSDMGESFGRYQLGRPEEVMKYITTALIACGFHAGDPLVMNQTVRLAKKYNVTVGAHPGLPDLMGFGRRYMQITPEEAKYYMIYQLASLKGIAKANGVDVKTIKPHGALYNWCIESEENAKVVVEVIKAIDEKLVLFWPALPEYPLIKIAEDSGIRVVREFYPGLTYKDNGAIGVARTYEEDTPERIVELVLKFLKEGKVTTIDGNDIDIYADSICVHGDIYNAPEMLAALREALNKEGIIVESLV